MDERAPATTLHLTAIEPAGGAWAFRYTVDGTLTGEIRVDYPFPLDEAAPLLPAVGAGVAVYLGQLTLAERIELGFGIGPDAIAALAPLAEMLYDIRRWKDELPLAAPPAIAAPPGPERPPPAHDPAPGRSLLLWSGGKDSTLGAIKLRDNGRDVRAVHFTVNEGVAARESAAVERLSRRLELPVMRVDYVHEQFLELSTRYARNWNDFPLCNTVPFGRDMLLALLAVPVARHIGAGELSLGHDNDCRTAFVRYGGKRIPRNDVESAEGALALESYIRAFMTPSLALLPPLAQMSEYRILHEMFTRHPELMGETSFCFWDGDNCGRCAKCLRYFLMQRVVGAEGTLDFAVDPLAPGACPELDDLLGPDDNGLLFRSEVLYCLARLVERGDVREGEDRLWDFERTLYPELAPHLDARESELMALRPDPQVPGGFGDTEAAVTTSVESSLRGVRPPERLSQPQVR